VKWDDRIGRRLKLHDLHVLLTVVEVGSMGRAAERLAVSQPSVSKAIADMEHTIGVRLLDRTPRGVECTAYGRALLRRSMGAFDELRQGIKDIESLTDPTVGEVRVGAPEAIACGLLSAVINEFSRLYPRVDVSVTAANNMSQEFRLLRDRQVDLMLGSISKPFNEDDLAADVLYEDRPYVLAGKGSKWARRRRIDLSELAGEAWTLPKDSIFSAGIAEAFRAKGIEMPQHGVRSYSAYQRITLTATNRFISAESGSVLRFNADRFALKVLPVDLAVRPWPIAVVTLKKRTISPVVESFVRCAREVAKPLRRPR
jgi:DNA-binding transcriptional LysR family regulator